MRIQLFALFLAAAVSSTVYQSSKIILDKGARNSITLVGGANGLKNSTVGILKEAYSYSFKGLPSFLQASGNVVAGVVPTSCNSDFLVTISYRSATGKRNGSTTCIFTCQQGTINRKIDHGSVISYFKGTYNNKSGLIQSQGYTVLVPLLSDGAVNASEYRIPQDEQAVNKSTVAQKPIAANKRPSSSTSPNVVNTTTNNQSTSSSSTPKNVPVPPPSSNLRNSQINAILNSVNVSIGSSLLNQGINGANLGNLNQAQPQTLSSANKSPLTSKSNNAGGQINTNSISFPSVSLLNVQSQNIISILSKNPTAIMASVNSNATLASLDASVQKQQQQQAPAKPAPLAKIGSPSSPNSNSGSNHSQLTATTQTLVPQNKSTHLTTTPTPPMDPSANSQETNISTSDKTFSAPVPTQSSPSIQTNSSVVSTSARPGPAQTVQAPSTLAISSVRTPETAPTQPFLVPSASLSISASSTAASLPTQSISSTLNILANTNRPSSGQISGNQASQYSQLIIGSSSSSQTAPISPSSDGKTDITCSKPSGSIFPSQGTVTSETAKSIVIDNTMTIQLGSCTAKEFFPNKSKFEVGDKIYFDGYQTSQKDVYWGRRVYCQCN